MDLSLVLDTETTGFKKKGALIQDGQGRICQIALIACDRSGRTVNKFSTLIKPDGWKVSQYNIDNCGITQDDCEKYGMTIAGALYVMSKFVEMSNLLIAHNSEFDQGMIDIELAYHNSSNARQMNFNKPWHCTMKTNTHISGGKWPKLNEALKHYCARELTEGEAHDALFDAQACKEIYFASLASSLSARQ